MSDNSPQSDVPTLDEDLVAYLDGELGDAAARRLEERLANDQSARERLRALATSWDLLDHLPRADLDEAFTRTTVELVVDEARKEIAAEQAALPARKRRRWIAAAVAGLATAMIGFTAVLAWPDANERLLRDLPVVQHLEWYDVVPRENGLDFLRRLADQELFVADVATAEPQQALDVEGGDADELLAARRAEVEALPPDKKNQLRKLYERFQSRTQEEQDRLREFHAELQADPQEPRLLAILESYHNWLPTLTPLDRAKLLKMPAGEAIGEVRRLKEQQLLTFGRSGGSRQGPLSSRDVDLMERWLQEWYWKRKDEILAKAPPEHQKWFDNLPEKQQKRSLMFVGREPGPPRPPKLGEGEWTELLGRLTTVKALFDSQGGAKADDLLKQFPKEVKENIKTAVSQATTLDEKQNLLFRWYVQAQRARDAFGGGVSREELDRFLREELNDEERRDLVSRPPEEAHRRLRFLYFVKKELPPGHFRGPGKWGRGRDARRDGPGEGPRVIIRRGGPPDGDSDRDGHHRRERGNGEEGQRN